MNPPLESVELAKAEVPVLQQEVDDKKILSEKQLTHSASAEAPVPPKYETSESDHDPDAPTEEELYSLRRVPGPVPWAAYTVAVVELCERFSYYGTITVFVNFIQQPLPPGSNTGAGFEGQSGALDMGQRASTGLTTFNSFWSYVMPLVGGYIADEYWGRYKTIMVAIIAAIVGHLFLIVSASPAVIVNPNTSIAVFAVGIIIMGIGTGGFKANISPLVAEQYKTTKLTVVTLPSGERVIQDPTLTVSRIYMYFYLMINLGSLIGQIGMVYAEKYVGFWLSFLLPTIMFLFCPIIMLICRNKYARSPPTGSVTSKAFKLWKLAMKGKWSANPVTAWRNMHSDDFWERVKPSNMDVATRPAWMTFDDEWVDQVRRGLKACSVFCWYPIYWLAYNQMTNNLTSQAATMQLNGIPNDVLNNLNPLSLIIFIPICDLWIYPALRRAKIRFTPLKRITGGFYMGMLAMIWSCIIQYYIYKKNPCGDHANSCDEVAPINVWAQTGAYILIAFSEIFASVTGLEYAFTKAPKNMRSMVVGVFFFMSAISSALGQALVALSEDPLLIWNYGVVAVLAGVVGTLFWLKHKRLDAEEDELNMLADSKFIGRQSGTAEERTDV